MTVKGLVLAADHATASVGGAHATVSPELFPVANQPILFHALDAMATAGITDVGLCGPAHRVAPLRDAVQSAARWPVRFAFIDDEEGRPSSAIRAAGDFLDGSPFLFQHGDGLLQDDLRGLLHAGRDRQLEALLLMHRRDGSPAAAGAQLLGASFAAGVHPYLDAHRDEAEIAGLVDGLSLVEGSDVRLIRGWRRFCEGDGSQALEMNRLLLDQLPDDLGDQGAAGCRIEGRVQIHPTALIESSTIRGPVIVGRGARISSSYVGPYTSIAEDVEIDGTEIEHSIVRAGARLLHVGARLEDTVIGRGARVSREFGVTRSLRMHLGDRAHIVLQ
jgi:glucose-1-phosphate thymidylyltransferase